MVTIIYWLKYLVRLAGAAFCYKTSLHQVGETSFVSCSGQLWPPATDEALENEILPLFEAIASDNPKIAIDAGAAVGMFSIPLLKRFPDLVVFSFEPSFPQRVLLKRNLRRNAVAKRAEIIPICLWAEAATVSFRTHGYLSGIKGVTSVPGMFLAKEKVPACTLDSWWEESGKPHVNLLKMDIEGSETEAIAGAQGMLRQCRPLLLIEAYHLRDGRRTFEAIAMTVASLGYEVREHQPGSGLLVARAR